MDSRPGISRRGVMGMLAALAATPAFALKGASFHLGRRGRAFRVGASPAGGGAPRYLHAAVSLGDGRVVVTGGYSENEAARNRHFSPPTASVQLYDPDSDVWVDLPPMITPRARHAAALLSGGRIAVLGGVFNGPLSSVEIYDPVNGAWQVANPLPQAVFDHAAAGNGDQIVITGGQYGTPALVHTVAIPQRALVP